MQFHLLPSNTPVKETVLLILSFCAVLPAWSAEPPQAAKHSVLIVDGMNNHDWARGTRILKEILTASALFDVDVSTTPPAGATPGDWAKWKPDFRKYNCVISNFNGGHTASGTRWPADVEKAFEDYVRGGGGFVSFHAANNAFLNWPAYNEMIGLGWRDKSFGPSLVVGPDEKIIRLPAGEGRGPGHGPEHDFPIHILAKDHPITRGMPALWMHPQEQLTHGQHGPAKDITVLTYAWSRDAKENEPMDWVVPFGKGRVYVTMLGHLWDGGPDATLRCSGFQTIFVRGVEWAATGHVTFPVPADFPTATDIKSRPGTATPP
jgi:type 1 glutamine amidotransferase